MKFLLRAINKIIDNAAVLALFAMVVLVFTNVTLRYVFDSGLAWSEEISRICFVWVVFLGIIIGTREQSHLTVDILVTKLKKTPAAIFRLISQLGTILVLGVCTIGGFKLMLLTHSQGLPSTGLPTSILYLAGVLSCSIVCLIIFSNLFSKSKKLEQEVESNSHNMTLEGEVK